MLTTPLGEDAAPEAALLSTAQAQVEALRPLAAGLRNALEAANGAAAAELRALDDTRASVQSGAVGRAARLERDYSISLRLLIRLRAGMDELLGLPPEECLADECGWTDSDSDDDGGDSGSSDDSVSRLARRLREMDPQIRLLRSRAAKAGVDASAAAEGAGAELRAWTLGQERAALEQAALTPPRWAR